MARQRFSAEQIIGKLREAGILLAKGQKVGQVSRALGITEQTYYRWRKEYGGLKVSQATRLKEPESDPINHQNIRGAEYYAASREEQIVDPPHHGKVKRNEADRHGQGYGRADGDEGHQFPLI